MMRNAGIRNDLPAYANRLTNGVDQLVGRSINNISLNLVSPTTIIPQASSRSSNIDGESMLIRFSCCISATPHF